LGHTLIDQRLTFRRDLQGLRAIAILLVILAHTNLGILPGGFIGVDVFFVLSGYLITGLLLLELEQSGRIAFTRFYSRRLKRLLPALIFMLSISSGVAIWLLSGVEARAQLSSSPFAATWTSNLYFAFTTIDYFDELMSKDLFLHTWSLGVEEQFYLLWPVILLILFRAGRLQSGDRQYEMKLMFLGLGIVLVASLMLSLLDSELTTCGILSNAIAHLAIRDWSLGLSRVSGLFCKQIWAGTEPRKGIYLPYIGCWTDLDHW